MIDSNLKQDKNLLKIGRAIPARLCVRTYTYIEYPRPLVHTLQKKEK